MKKTLLILAIFAIAFQVQSQTANDLFQENSGQITWLGVDFSNIKLIGDFSQFSGAGQQSYSEIQNDYYPGWNNLILNEPNKYDIKGMLKKSDIRYEIDMITEINANANIDGIRSYNNPNYGIDSITKFVEKYNTKNLTGIGVCLIAEVFNKIQVEAYYHFVAINLQTKEIIVHERVKGIPSGFGLRNYWAGSIYYVIKDVKKKRYRMWKSKYL